MLGAPRKNPARFPARAQLASFNFPNNLIWATASRVRARESSARRGEGHAAEHLSANDRYRFIAGKFSRRNWISAGLNERMRRFLHGLPHRSERRPIPAHARAQDRIFSIEGNARLGSDMLHIGTASPAQNGCSVADEPADGGGSAIIRGTSAPDPARMKAERAGRVYRVSHVVDGKVGNPCGKHAAIPTILPPGCSTRRDFLDRMMIEASL
jgi:hypothetical protein